MQTRSIAASLMLAAAATASPINAGSARDVNSMGRYCSDVNLGGACSYIDETSCGLTTHATKSIEVFDGFACDLFLSGGCGPSGQKTYHSGTYNTIEAKWANSAAITCFKGSESH
ncbi:hypothetical protein PGQ11_014748 [Apiospora arundinis]|uniref:Uncharacterized protein n=1 Tax=Apiospora arundinis TaxID=335852 RepID=A0ABR2HT62_9PEZI